MIKKRVIFLSGSADQHEQVFQVELSETPDSSGAYGYMHRDDGLEKKSIKVPIKKERYNGRDEFVARIQNINKRH